MMICTLIDWITRIPISGAILTIAIFFKKKLISEIT